jgi:hypothetical protein
MRIPAHAHTHTSTYRCILTYTYTYAYIYTYTHIYKYKNKPIVQANPRQVAVAAAISALLTHDPSKRQELESEVNELSASDWEPIEKMILGFIGKESGFTGEQLKTVYLYTNRVVDEAALLLLTIGSNVLTSESVSTPDAQVSVLIVE